MARIIDSVLGHEGVWKTLMSLMQRDRLPHAFAFTGSPGIGKSLTAWALAQALVCEREERPCGECGPCLRVERRQSENVLLVEPQGAMIKLEAADQILDFLSLQQIGRARIVIIDQAQLLNPQAANALLKVVEEPPQNTYFILIAPEISQLLPTLRSRAQVFRFQPLRAEILARGENLPAWVLRSSRGSFENLEVFRNPEFTELRKAVMFFLKSSFAGKRDGLQEVLDMSKDKEVGPKVIRLLQEFLRDWLLLGQDDLLHADLQSELSSLPVWDSRAKSDLLRQSFQMEADLLGHIDRQLIFENFFFRVKPALE